MVYQKWTATELESINSPSEFREHFADKTQKSEGRELPNWLYITESNSDERFDQQLNENTRLKLILTEDGDQCIALGYVPSPIGTSDVRRFIFNMSKPSAQKSAILNKENAARRFNSLDLDDTSSLQQVFNADSIEQTFAKKFQETLDRISSVLGKNTKHKSIDGLSVLLLGISKHSQEIDSSLSTFQVIESVGGRQNGEQIEYHINSIWRRIIPGKLAMRESTPDTPKLLADIQRYERETLREAGRLVDQFICEFDWQVSASQEYWDVTQVSPKVIGDAFERYLTQEHGEYTTPAELSLHAAEETVISVIDRKVSQYGYDSLADMFGVEELQLYEKPIITDTAPDIPPSIIFEIIQDMLPSLRIADIATGGGTYIVAVFDVLARLWNCFSSTIDEATVDSLDGVPSSVAQKSLITQGLWLTGSRVLSGVDINEEATLLTRFRLNLSFQSSSLAESPEEPLRLAHTILCGDSVVGHPYSEHPPHWNGQLPLTYWFSDIESDVEAEQLTATPQVEEDRLSDAVEQYYSVTDTSQAIYRIDRQSVVLGEYLQRRINGSGPHTSRSGIQDHRDVPSTSNFRQFHWGAEFKNVLENGGFDSVIFQAPWNDEKFSTRKGDPRADFIKSGGQYSLPPTKGWYRTSFDVSALMMHRAHDIVQEGGIITASLPTKDFRNPRKHHFRRRYLDNTSIDILANFLNQTTFENIDRRYEFSLLITQAEDETETFQTRSEIVSIESAFEDGLVEVSRDLIQDFSPKTLAFPPIKNQVQRDALNNLCNAPIIHQGKGGISDDNQDGWVLSMRGELHTARDEEYIRHKPAENSTPVFQGKNIDQFRLNKSSEANEDNVWTISPSEDGFPTVDYLREKWKKQRANQQADVFPPSVPRVVYRRIARSSDERTMIATLLPPGHFHANSVRSINPNVGDRDTRDQLVLIALLNSIPFDYLLRRKTNTDIRDYNLYETRLPNPVRESEAFNSLWESAARLLKSSYPEPHEFASRNIDIQALFTDLCQEERINSESNEENRRQLRAEIDATAFRLFGFDSQRQVESLLDDFDYVRNPSLMDRYYRQQVLENFGGGDR